MMKRFADEHVSGILREAGSAPLSIKACARSTMSPSRPFSVGATNSVAWACPMRTADQEGTTE